ncbi:hypothetical protein B0H14DRAFT_3735630 [Mycena olivaceomarginata]|nr:hypothetical protein B0H14DRAFT_3735630 [Mycena olivaceomarginata]
MPATEQSSRTYTCGLSLSLHADFVFRAYRKTPTELSVLGGTRILCWDANTVRPRDQGPLAHDVHAYHFPNSNPTPPSTDSQWQLNGSRQSIVEDDPNTEFRVIILSSALTSPVQTAFSPVIAAVPHLTTIIYTDTSDAESSARAAPPHPGRVPLHNMQSHADDDLRPRGRPRGPGGTKQAR